MAKKPRVLNDAEIVTRVLAVSKESVSWYDSKLSKERSRVIKYYNGELPARQHAGSASYVSTDVYDAVSMMKAQLLEVYAGGEQIARFDPDNEMGAEDCRIATEYARYVIFRENNGYEIFSHVFHDGLIARAGVVKVFWEEKYEYTEEHFTDLAPQDAIALASQEDVDTFDADQDEQTGLYSGSLSRKKDCCGVRIVNVPPEEFLISPRALRLGDRGVYCGHRTLKVKSELIDMGYDPKVINELHYDDNKGLDMSPEVQDRNEPVETAQALNDPIQPQQEKVMYYESYVWMEIDPSKGTRLYKICHVNDVLLDKQEVDRVPFLVYVPLPVPHLFYGDNFAARVIPYQNARTVLTRGVLDHTAITTNPRWQVVKGGLLNPREMLDNRLGGIVNVRTAESVTALAYPNMNPFVFNILGMLQENKEQSTGISSLSQGLNKDAISTQNSQGLVGDLVNLSATRQKIASRNFAYNFFVPLMIEVIRLAIQYEKKPKWIEVAGSPMKVTTDGWTDRTTCSVSTHLGYGEKDKTINEMVSSMAALKQDPQFARMVTDDNAYTFARDVMKMRGWANANSYITNPKQLPPPQPDPMKVAEMQNKGKLADAAVMKAQTDATKVQTNMAVDATKVHQGQQKMVLDALNHDREQDRKDFDIAHKVRLADREMALAEKTATREAIVSPKV